MFPRSREMKIHFWTLATKDLFCLSIAHCSTLVKKMKKIWLNHFKSSKFSNQITYFWKQIYFVTLNRASLASLRNFKVKQFQILPYLFQNIHLDFGKKRKKEKNSTKSLTFFEICGVILYFDSALTIFNN